MAKMKKIPQITCDFCGMYTETVEHLFFDCIISKNFWFDLFGYLNKSMQTNIQITAYDVILCFKYEDKDVEIYVNRLCLYGKRYIQICKYRKVIPHINGFYNFCLENLRYCKEIKENSLSTFYDKIEELKNVR